LKKGEKANPLFTSSFVDFVNGPHLLFRRSHSQEKAVRAH
jgi:hypothetical protein